MDDIVIGIDLGTTNTCAAYFKNGVVEILENVDGKRITPSCVFFQKKLNSLPIVGQFAKKMTDMTPPNGVYEIKRFVGRSFKEVEHSLKYFSFNVTYNNGEPAVVIKQEVDTFKKTPQDITALILTKVKKDVEMKLGGVITKAVITVPAYFNTSQREVTLAAANQAGFTVLKMFNEPTAAALSYYFKTEEEEECYSLVYDLGGGTFDVSLLRRNSAKIDIICVDGDTNLGGKDLDNLIIEHVCEKLKRDYNYDATGVRRDMRRIQNKCEEAKIELSTVEETVIILEGLLPEHPMITIPFTKAQFDSKAQSLFKRTLTIVKNCLKSGQVTKTQIKDVILAGGSSRIPKIQEMLSKFFDGANLTKFVNLDECVAEGAALQAALLSSNPKQKIKKLTVTDVTRLSIGIGDSVDRMTVVIPKNSPIPITASKNFVTSEDNQPYCTFAIFEGERRNVAKNREIATIVLENLTPAPPGQCRMCTEFTINNDGILRIKAFEHLNDNVKEITVKYISGTRNDLEVNSVVVDAEEHAEEDLRFEKFAEKKFYLLEYCQAVCYNMRTLKLEERYSSIYQLCEEVFDQKDSITMEAGNSPEEMLARVEKQCQLIVKVHKFTIMPELPASLKK